MSDETAQFPPLPPRLTTGIAGLDDILRGGLFKGGIYIVSGRPGSGKTTIGHQVAFHHVANGGRALYVTLLSETHARMLSQMREMSFFDANVVGQALIYANGFSAVETDGLDGLLKLLRRAVRDHRADLLVLDGMVTASTFAKAGVDYKKFINELQTWLGVVGCTALFLTSDGSETMKLPEHSMVDGIFELDTERSGLRSERHLRVTKFRGSAFTEGAHPYVITSQGVVVYPRVEGHYAILTPGASFDERVTTGVPGLDEITAGGLTRGSSALVLGPSGSGKTILGLQFLAAGEAQDEAGLYFGFYETPPDLLRKAERIGLPFRRMIDRDRLSLIWNPSSECLLDRLADQLLTTVRARGVKRLMLDGMEGFRGTLHPERLAPFFATLTEELSRLGATTLLTEETRELFATEITVPTHGVSAVFHNILFLRAAEHEGELIRLLTVMKMRDSRHSRQPFRVELTDRGARIVATTARLGSRPAAGRASVARQKGKRGKRR